MELNRAGNHPENQDLEEAESLNPNIESLRTTLPQKKSSFIDSGYLFGNNNGRSGYNIIIEGLTLTCFFATLFALLWNYDENIESSDWWMALLVIPLIRCILLIPDLFLLISYKKYSWWNILSLLSSISVWCFAISSFSSKDHYFLTILMYDNIIQLSLLVYFLWQVYEKLRVIDLFRDYYNPLNFFASTTVVAILQDFSRRTSTYVWYTNMGIVTIIGLVLLGVYLYFLFNLFRKKPAKLQLISKFYILY